MGARTTTAAHGGEYRLRGRRQEALSSLALDRRGGDDPVCRGGCGAPSGWWWVVAGGSS
jgi:hypothetical protein